MRTRVRQIDKDKWIVEKFEQSEWRHCGYDFFKTKTEAENFAFYQSKSDVVHADFFDGIKKEAQG